MSKEADIRHVETGDGGRYEASVADSDEAGLLSYRFKDEATIVAEHTLVPDALRGRGIASALVERLVADAQAKGLKIVPQCSFVRAAFERHPEWAALRYGSNTISG